MSYPNASRRNRRPRLSFCPAIPSTSPPAVWNIYAVERIPGGWKIVADVPGRILSSVDGYLPPWSIAGHACNAWNIAQTEDGSRFDAGFVGLPDGLYNLLFAPAYGCVDAARGFLAGYRGPVDFEA